EIKVVNELLDISQFQLGKDVVLLQPNVDLEPILKEIVDEIKIEADKKGPCSPLMAFKPWPRRSTDPSS
ncbi:MAG: hypothetical protein NTU60_06215, partial [Candidatus Aminicenantes bacterium]|nr:hypothetical protein [Candidatus Aminicenantes bacterium]